MIKVIHRKLTFSNNEKLDKEERELRQNGWELVETKLNRPLGIFKYKKIWELEYGTIKEKGDL